MRMGLLWIMVWCTISVSIVKFPSVVNSDPIKIDFAQCQPAAYQPSLPNTTMDTPFQFVDCCPAVNNSRGPIIDGFPPPSTNYTRVRRAAQCTDAAYAEKLYKAYELMRALPDDDPRSFTQQILIHCAYCGGSFYSTNNRNTTEIGIDVHWGWLFYPWHRFFLYFHERILQSLLGDPTFSLNYWNWDNPYTIGGGDMNSTSCLKSGKEFPLGLYGDPSKATYDENRSEMALGNARLPFPDFTFSVILPAVAQPLYNASAEELVRSNLNVLYQAMVAGGTTPETFVGLPYRVGDQRGNPFRGAGSLENSAHTNIHSWIGKDPYTFIDMGTLRYASRDPVFYSHHSNIDRLFTAWRDIGPLVGQNRDYYSDPDFLNAELLFYDENADLRRVKVGDGLNITKLGYTYQGSNDNAWIFPNQTKCSTTSYADLINQTESLPVPSQDREGYYNLKPDTLLILVVDRPFNPHGAEEFLVIQGIKMNRAQNGGFEVYLNLPSPYNYTYPTQCAEYSGELSALAQGSHSTFETTEGIWKQSISRTLTDLQLPASASKVVVTVVPYARAGYSNETIQFSSIAIEVART